MITIAIASTTPLAVLEDTEARKFIKGVAWHLYAGEIEAISAVAKKHTTIKTYFTECWVGAGSEFAEGLRWHVENIPIGASRNGARAILEWNLAGDPNHGPHTEERVRSLPRCPHHRSINDCA
jgi:glucosylceramidase